MPNPNSTRQEWEQLYHNLSSSAPNLQRDFPSVPPKITPLVNEPVCDEEKAHCRRHFVDREIVCACGAKPYVVVAHEWPWSEGHYWHKVESQNGAPPYEPARQCPQCQRSL